MPTRSRKSDPSAQSAKDAEQKKILFALVGLIGVLLLGAVLWLFIGSSGSSSSDTKDAQSAEAETSQATEERVDGLGENWDERLAEAEAAHDRIMEKPRAEPDLMEDAVFMRMMGRAKSALAEAKRESSGGDPVEARKAIAKVMESEGTLNNYLEAKAALNESGIVTRYNEARDMAVEFRLQSFQSDLYKEALALRQEAESATAEGKLEEASAAYEAAIERFNEAKERFDATVANARKTTTAAVEAGNREEGEAAVQQILERLPGDEFGERMRIRLTVLDQTHPLYQRALASEENELFSVAEGQYRSILGKDPHHTRASDGLNRVIEARKGLVVAERITEAEAAAEDGELEEALKLVGQALAVSPGDKAAGQLKEDLQKRFDSERIKRSLQEAAAYEAKGDWEQAMALYSSLASDFSGLVEAKNGLERVRKGAQQVEEARQLVEVAKESMNVSSVEALEYAIGLLERATRLNANDQSIRVLLEATQEDLKLMNAPIRVTLVSDGKTKIEVWRVGVFESVTTQRLDLKPGSYTVVGKKPFYVDVKLDLTVPPGAEPIRLEVKCEEAL